MGNWSRLERSPVQRYQGWEGGVNSGRDASEVKPLIMITNWSWLLERQAAAVGRRPLKCPPPVAGSQAPSHEETLELCGCLWERMSCDARVTERRMAEGWTPRLVLLTGLWVQRRGRWGWHSGTREREQWDQGEGTVGPGRGNNGTREREQWDEGEGTVGPGRGNSGTREREQDCVHVLPGPNLCSLVTHTHRVGGSIKSVPTHRRRAVTDTLAAP
ncbi:hypothetical protein KUCAC02_005237 [Chaenocephalus aceratus]|uniref:Uncharacterized protein n=1 Tax=Chaenocephalus aceratus TaxID=36190 RepID=A0ACB9WPH0_CHAAC|nr:hypothetical protein KUCAC02_005237 [Chaenocephalus aceratus]